MRLGMAQGVSKLPPMGRMLLLAVAVSFCFILGTGSSEAQSDDHGNSFSTATTLRLGSSIAGRIDPGDDWDAFKLDLSSASGNTSVWIYTTGNLDTLGGLYDSHGTVLYANDNTTITGGVVVETNFRIPRTLAPGVYYVGVFSSAGDGVWSATAAGTPATTEGAPSVTVTRSDAAPLGIGTPIPMTATFGEPVFGFTVDDVSVKNGAAGNLAGSGAVYTFDVTPNAVGEVTVDIAAGVAADADGNGNTAAPRLLLGIPYDDDGDGAISRSEVIAAINDYLFGDGSIARSHVIDIINLYLFA